MATTPPLSIPLSGAQTLGHNITSIMKNVGTTITRGMFINKHSNNQLTLFMTTIQAMSNIQNTLLHVQTTNPFITLIYNNTYENTYMPPYNTPSATTQMLPQNSYIPFQTSYMPFQMSYAHLQYQHTSQLAMGWSVLSPFTTDLLNVSQVRHI